MRMSQMSRLPRHWKHVIKPAIPSHVSPAASSSLTLYGGWGARGGDTFSGKDPTKADRSGAYIARQAAKSMVASGLARRSILQVSFAIGVPEPLSVFRWYLQNWEAAWQGYIGTDQGELWFQAGDDFDQPRPEERREIHLDFTWETVKLLKTDKAWLAACSTELEPAFHISICLSCSYQELVCLRHIENVSRESWFWGINSICWLQHFFSFLLDSFQCVYNKQTSVGIPVLDGFVLLLFSSLPFPTGKLNMFKKLWFSWISNFVITFDKSPKITGHQTTEIIYIIRGRTTV